MNEWPFWGSCGAATNEKADGSNGPFVTSSRVGGMQTFATKENEPGLDVESGPLERWDIRPCYVSLQVSFDTGTGLRNFS